MKRKKLRRALVSSIMSLTLCSAMLLGTTYAWLTDSVVSTGARVIAGTLQLDLLTYTENEDGTRSYKSIAGKTGDLFYDEENESSTVWEPGTVKSVNLAVKNEGDLELKYEIGLIVKDAGLAELLEYSIVHVDEDADDNGIQMMAEVEDADDIEDTENEEDTEEWLSLSDYSDQENNGNVSYMIISEEKTIPVPEEEESTEERSMFALADAEEDDERLDHFVLSVRMKDIATKEAAEKYKQAQCEIDICIIATQSMSETDDSGEEVANDEIAIPTPVMDDYVYHFATVDIKLVDDAYVTTEVITASSSNAKIQIEVPEDVKVDGSIEKEEEERVIVIAITPQTLTTDMELETTRPSQTVDVKIYGISESNEVPFTLIQDIGVENRLEKIIYTTDESEHCIVVDEETGTAKDPETGNEYEYDSEIGYGSAYDPEIGYGFFYDPENGFVTIQSLHQGMFTLVFEEITDEEE